MNNKELTWEDVEKSLNITPEQEIEIQLEMDIIKATIEARKKANLSKLTTNYNPYKTIISNGLYFKNCSSG